MTTENTELPGENIAITNGTSAAAPAESSNASGEPAVAPGKQRGRSAMSARLDADDQTTRQRNVEHAAANAKATGKRRDLLSYLRLRRRTKNKTA